MRRVGTVRYNSEWELTERRKAAIERLIELGVDVGFSHGHRNFTLMIPRELTPIEYIEIGYITAQLGDDHFPENYYALTEEVVSRFAASPVNPGTGKAGIEFAESFPDSYKFRVNV